MAAHGEVVFATDVQHNTTRQQTRDSDANMLRDGKKITAENARQFIKYEEAFCVLICTYKHHRYAVRNLENHLRLYHEGSRKDREDVVALFRECRLRHPSSVPLPAPLGEPLAALGKPKKAFICDEPECEEISVSSDKIRKHCNTAHKWRSSKARDRYWHPVWVQTFFSAAGLQRYFTVNYEESEEQNDAENRGQSKRGAATASTSLQISSVLQEWDQALEKQKLAQEKADSELAKTDRTGWFSRTRWPEHLADCNLRHLSHATRLPDRDETELQQIVQLVAQLLERSVSGLATLDDEIRRWLRSAKLHEPDVRPLSRLQNAESQATYARYMQRLVCYSMRVSKNWESQEGEERDGRDRSEDESGSGSESDDESGGSSDEEEDNNTATDFFSDAKRLFPWQDNVKEILKNIWESIERRAGEEQQLQAISIFFRELIFWKVRGKIFDSTLMHFLAVLGINEDTNRSRGGNDFSYMLAGVVYCSRVLAVEILLPSVERDEQTVDDDRRFLQQRREYLADGSFSPMSKMLSLLAYGKHIALNHGNAGAVLWSRDGKEMAIRGMPIRLTQFQKMVHDVVSEAEDMLWRKLMWTKDRERVEIPLDKLKDDVTFTKRGISFVNNGMNGLEDKREWMLTRAFDTAAGKRMHRRGEWVMRHVRAYLREVDRFREILLLCVHLTGGQPARGTEISTVRFRNGYAQDRNVFVIHGQIVVVTRYHKSQSQLDKPKVIPRFLPWRVGQLLAVYLVYVQSFQEYLSVQVKGSGWSDYVWANEKGPWETDRLTKVITRETESRLGVRLTTHDYRHTAISVGRRVVGDGFAHGYAEEMADIEEPEMEGDDALEMSAGRGGEVGMNRYGVSVDVIKHLSSRTVDTFRPLSEKWHEFLGLSSHGGTGRKRGREERSNSAFMEQEVTQEERRMVLALRKNGIGGWQEAMASYSMPNATSAVAETEKEGEESGQQTEERMQVAVRKVLQCEDFSFRSKEQGEALRRIVREQDRGVLVVVLPTGGGKSLLFMAPACMDDPGVTIVVVPFRSLINDLVAKAKKLGIDCIEWRPGEVNPAALVYVSADFVPFTGFLSYARLLQEKGILRRIFVDECHLTFTASDWRPKLAWLRSVRGLRCPTILLTATLPVVCEFELEASMAAAMARYIRAVTTRVRTRYTVQQCKPGEVQEEALRLCRRMQKHLGFRKGVVYSRSRTQCESFAAELESAHYHAGAVDNEERLTQWLEKGGFIVATSALGTGVDFPDVVFVLHIDLPYGMIDFAQESGRAGRGGEDVDSVIIIADNRTQIMQRDLRGVDDDTMAEFVKTKSCRRRVMSSYLDGQDICCEDGEGAMARCDNCGEGITALEREHRKAAQERRTVERTLDELADGCGACWVMSKAWRHAALECTVRKRQEIGLDEVECDRFRGTMQSESKSHSCHRCGISQRLCATRQDNKVKCQWPNVLVPIVRGLRKTAKGRTVLRRVGFEGDEEEDGEEQKYGRWLGQRHPRRVWGEVVSNATAVMIATIIERQERQEQESERGKKDSQSEVMEMLQEWDGVCLICRAARGVAESGHRWEGCRGAGDGEEDEFRREMVKKGIEHVREMEQRGGKEWIRQHGCDRGSPGSRGECNWCKLIGEVAIALVYVGPEAVRKWVVEDEAFEQEEKEGRGGFEMLEGRFRRETVREGRRSSGIEELVRRWG